MAVVVRVPPGRAGRIALRRRLATAQRGREQLDRKLRLLIPEQQRQKIRAEVARTEWLEACADAQTWTLRAAVLGGQDALRHATPIDSAQVEIAWAHDMGLRYPSAATVTPPPDTPDRTLDNAAVPAALAAARKALQAAAASAAAEEAVRLLDAEVKLTRRRLRALEKAWLPALNRALSALELSLEQTEQEDNIRLRRAAPTPPQRSTQ